MIVPSSTPEPWKQFSSVRYQHLKKILFFNSLSSTNKTAKELARQNEPSGTIVITTTQTDGRGRFDRKWVSPSGGIYLSILLRPQCSAETSTILPLLGALMVATTLRQYAIPSLIKWPNDVQVLGKKIAGILLESEGQKDHVKFVILGTGINLNIDMNQFPKELQITSTSLAHHLGKPVDLPAFVRRMLSVFDEYYAHFLNGNSRLIIQEWKRFSDTLGRRVRIKTITNDEIIGSAVDITNTGFLVITPESGENMVISSGDCFYLDGL
jgi:BirA family biotin operon repressor/biotin-[acetyl-CoA-carboxylase] ligase